MIPTFLYYVILTVVYLLINPSYPLQQFLLPWIILHLAFITEMLAMKK